MLSKVPWASVWVVYFELADVAGTGGEPRNQAHCAHLPPTPTLLGCFCRGAQDSAL